MSQDESSPTKARRERSTRHPGVPLAESVELCKFIEARGLDGLTAPDIASSLGYKNIKTNTFSARLSAARQFGLLVLKDEGYSLTPLARSILHPVDPAEVPRLYRQALLEPPLYSELAGQFAEKRLPEASILGNVLYHNYQIIASAKQSAAEAFLESARFAGALGEDQVFRPQGTRAEVSPPIAERPVVESPPPIASESKAVERSSDVRIDLRLWGSDAGKAIRLRAPESITPESFERLIQTIRLHVRIEEPEAG
ncbi:hypothetical protein P12x_003445 [Tundrisphaera lichenicola]|uniref:hypothetical protein n=1 Tax=Tundrisphaera lichenicola TaxID=2029860 RepID=UPI003EBD15AC